MSHNAKYLKFKVGVGLLSKFQCNVGFVGLYNIFHQGTSKLTRAIKIYAQLKINAVVT